MLCPHCGSPNVIVRDSRLIEGDRQRRRVCRPCNAQWFTHEVMVEGTLIRPPPEPEWWTTARALRREGMTPTMIARTLGRAFSTVQDVLRPTMRAKSRARAKAAVSDPEGRKIRNLKATARREAMDPDLRREKQR